MDHYRNGNINMLLFMHNGYLSKSELLISNFIISKFIQVGNSMTIFTENFNVLDQFLVLTGNNIELNLIL
jgi:predicted glutamine amidotransferase